MAGLLWMSVSVLLFESCTGITEEQLAPMVDVIWNNYKINTMFSLAACIPKNQNQEDRYDVSQVLNAETPEAVKTAMKNKEVYAQGRIVAAKVIPNPDVRGEYIHAEYRVLQNFDNLLNQQFDYEKDLMLFYVRAAPCVQKCTNESDPENILKYLPKLKRWKHYAFAFSGLYLSRNPQKSLSDEQRRAGVKKVGDSLGLQNVFRCLESNGQMQCRTCADQNNQVADFCFSDSPSPQSNDENSVTPAPAVPNALVQPTPSNTGDGNTMTDEAQSQGGEATEGNQDNTDQEASSSQTRPGNDVTEGGQAGREGGGRIGGGRGTGSVGKRGGRQRIGGRRGKGKVGRRGGRQRIGGRRGKGRVGRRGGRQRIGGRRGKGKVGRRGGRRRIGGRRGKGRVGRRGGRQRIGGRRGKGRVGRRGGRQRIGGRRGKGKVGRRGGRQRIGGRRGKGRVGRRGGRQRIGGRRGKGKVGRRGGRQRTGRRRGKGRVGRRGGRQRIGGRRGKGRVGRRGGRQRIGGRRGKGRVGRRGGRRRIGGRRGKGRVGRRGGRQRIGGRRGKGRVGRRGGRQRIGGRRGRRQRIGGRRTSRWGL